MVLVASSQPTLLLANLPLLTPVKTTQDVFDAETLTGV